MYTTVLGALVGLEGRLLEVNRVMGVGTFCVDGLDGRRVGTVVSATYVGLELLELLLKPVGVVNEVLRLGKEVELAAVPGLGGNFVGLGLVEPGLPATGGFVLLGLGVGFVGVFEYPVVVDETPAGLGELPWKTVDKVVE